MVEIVNQKFFGETVDMNDKRFIGCQFLGCILRYKGGEWSWDGMTTFDERCFWKFEDCALRTTELLYFLGAANKPLAAGQF
jgi:hypothetical protein